MLRGKGNSTLSPSNNVAFSAFPLGTKKVDGGGNLKKSTRGWHNRHGIAVPRYKTKDVGGTAIVVIISGTV